MNTLGTQNTCVRNCTNKYCQLKRYPENGTTRLYEIVYFPNLDTIGTLL